MALQAGDTFGRYELVSWLGRGGMAETWRAQLVGDAGVTKPVLIKKVLPEYANDEAFISMFISEARISATLSHGNVAQVFDFGRVDGEYFLAMEFVDGQPLHRVLKRAMKSGMGPLPIPVAVFIAMEMCRGLHYAHTRTDSSGRALGIVHRDISPDNVLLGYEGQVKIVDFGIAKAQLIRGFKTAPGVVKGKYLFFSPEQARGEDVDARTDVWATGVVLYELLCGKLPVEGPPHVVMMRVAHGEIPAPSVLRPELPRELNDIVRKALTSDREQRFESSHAFGDALAGFLHASFPRLSSLSLAHLLRELFKQDLAQEGRELPVPETFRDDLAGWNKPAPPLVKPAVKPRAPIQTGQVDAPQPVTARPDAPAASAPASRKWLLRLGFVFLVASVSWAMFVLGSALPTLAEDTAQTTHPSPEAGPDAEIQVTTGKPSQLREEKARQDLELAKSCLQAQPEDADCHLMMASSYRQLGNFPESALHYRAFLACANPKDSRRDSVTAALGEPMLAQAAALALPSFHSRVRELLDRRAYLLALDLAAQCEAQYPEDAECQLLLGMANARLEKPAESAEHYQKFVLLASEDEPLRQRVADLLRGMGIATPVAPEPPPQFYDFAQSLSAARRAVKKEQPQEAINHYRAAFMLRRSSVEARTGLAILLTQTGEHGDCQEATELLSKLVAEAPTRAKQWYWLGMAHHCTNKLDPAARALKKYLSLEPRGAEAASAREVLQQLAPFAP
ncbi:protein kinase [Corallococcus macrosporus]|uniref:Protein kinase n=1 Tax=Corallococcus macrosporus TaxID=35 RepID=A0ABS3DAD0_9BACT|nr:serine/threonine-protein kinase [Corallococcus macrosporus]MBN8228598.1 protein kinase [Corallococcus macrosporus]